MEDARLDNILSKVRGLVAKAEHPDTPEAEAELCRRKADEMMLKYAIDQATLRDSQPVDERAKPAKMEVIIIEAGSPYERRFVELINVIALHCRCQMIVRGVDQDTEVILAWQRYYKKPMQVTGVIYGFESDLKYFEILYTTLLLHLSNGVDPRFDTSKSDRLNSYDLHNAGFNWGHIAQMAYKIGHEHGWNGEKVPAGETYPGKYWKNQYNKEIRSRNEAAVRLPAKFTESAREIWRLNFAKSYVGTIQRRLWISQSDRQAGSALVLKSSMDEVNKMLAENHPDTTDMNPDKELAFNETAWRAGDRHAKTADLLGNAGVDNRPATAIG